MYFAHLFHFMIPFTWFLRIHCIYWIYNEYIFIHYLCCEDLKFIIFLATLGCLQNIEALYFKAVINAFFHFNVCVAYFMAYQNTKILIYFYVKAFSIFLEPILNSFLFMEWDRWCSSIVSHIDNHLFYSCCNTYHKVD